VYIVRSGRIFSLCSKKYTDREVFNDVVGLLVYELCFNASTRRSAPVFLHSSTRSTSGNGGAVLLNHVIKNIAVHRKVKLLLSYLQNYMPRIILCFEILKN
jgi:hypothetical protein